MHNFLKFKIILALTVTFSLSISNTLKAQDSSTSTITKKKLEKKGQLFLYWGWNRSSYTKSDIHFTGNNYDFTLQNSVAKDRQSPFNWKTYFSPSTITIPQYNFRLGYFIKDDLNINIGIDHMKYVFVANQTLNIDGTINVGNAVWDGTYSNTPIVASPDLLTFEHTDGLNYVSVGVTKLWNLHKSEDNKIEIDGLVGPDIGIMIPKTNATLFGSGADEVHISGWGAALKTGLHIVLWKNLLLQGEIKGGYINMSDVITRGSSSVDRASHNFWFIQGIYTVGAIFPLNFNKK